jgi:hypothetical protein
MNRIAFSASLFVAASMTLSLPADAVTQGRYSIQTGANMCTLSVPTIDTKVRPKATGFNNEGTTNAFVICSFNPPPGSTGISSGFDSVDLVLKSLDGNDHSVTCTAVNSVAGAEFGDIPAPQYVSKTLVVNDANPDTQTLGTDFHWAPEDFGGTDTIPFSGGTISVTCILPPQVSVKLGTGLSDEDIGS